MHRIELLGLALLCTGMTFMPATAQVTPTAPAPISSPPSEAVKPAGKSLEVKYRAGLMSIRCQNATLREVLSAVSLKTGAEVDLPPALAGEHITAQLGPASTKEVLEQLLSSSRFDYVLLGSEQTGKVSHIVLREPETISSEIDDDQNSGRAEAGSNDSSGDQSQADEAQDVSSKQDTIYQQKQVTQNSNKKLKSSSVTTQEEFHDR
jgi:hypothetical protein